MCNSSLEPNNKVHRSLQNYFGEICEPPDIIKHYNQYTICLVQQVKINGLHFTTTTALVGTVSNNEKYLVSRIFV